MCLRFAFQQVIDSGHADAAPKAAVNLGIQCIACRDQDPPRRPATPDDERDKRADEAGTDHRPAAVTFITTQHFTL